MHHLVYHNFEVRGEQRTDEGLRLRGAREAPSIIVIIIVVLLLLIIIKVILLLLLIIIMILRQASPLNQRRRKVTDSHRLLFLASRWRDSRARVAARSVRARGASAPPGERQRRVSHFADLPRIFTLEGFSRELLGLQHCSGEKTNLPCLSQWVASWGLGRVMLEIQMVADRYVLKPVAEHALTKITILRQASPINQRRRKVTDSHRLLFLASRWRDSRARVAARSVRARGAPAPPGERQRKIPHFADLPRMFTLEGFSRELLGLQHCRGEKRICRASPVTPITPSGEKELDSVQARHTDRRPRCTDSKGSSQGLPQLRERDAGVLLLLPRKQAQLPKQLGMLLTPRHTLER